LDAAIDVMDEAVAAYRPPRGEDLFQRIEHEPDVGRARGPPADDAAGIGIRW
jgi:hypothetical protein